MRDGAEPSPDRKTPVLSDETRRLLDSISTAATSMRVRDYFRPQGPPRSFGDAAGYQFSLTGS